MKGKEYPAFLTFLIRSNIWVALAFSMWVLQTQILWGKISYHLPLFCFFSTLLTYNLQRVYKYQIQNNGSEFSLWIEKNLKSLYFIMALSLFGVLYSLVKLQPTDILLLILPFLSSVFYVVKFPFFSTKKSLRELPLTKIFVIAIAWAVVGVLLPLNPFYTNFETQSFLFFSLEKLLFVIGITIPFDVRDMMYDSPNLQTIPQRIGRKRAFRLSYLIILSSFIFVFVLYFLGFYTQWVFYAQIITYVLTLLLINQSRKSKKIDFHGFFLDGIFLFQSLLILILSFWN